MSGGGGVYKTSQAFGMGNGHESGGADFPTYSSSSAQRESSALTRGVKAGVLQVVQTPVKELGERSFPKSQVRKSKNMGVSFVIRLSLV